MFVSFLLHGCHFAWTWRPDADNVGVGNVEPLKRRFWFLQWRKQLKESMQYAILIYIHTMHMTCRDFGFWQGTPDFFESNTHTQFNAMQVVGLESSDAAVAQRLHTKSHPVKPKPRRNRFTALTRAPGKSSVHMGASCCHISRQNVPWIAWQIDIAWST